ncbi:MAG: GerMN domain-containing protein [Thermoanaerobacteraceae bacterium]|nr:GerMN domain-containing protein [Thermoanaerobacteraceae bacterium]
MKRLLYAIFTIFIVFILIGCGAQSTTDTMSASEDVSSVSSGKMILVYYIKDGFLTPVTYNIEDSESEVSSALNLLFSEVCPKGFESQLTNTQLNTLEVSGDTVYLDISGDALEGDKAELAKNQIIYTLTDCPNITKINISVDGKPYADSLVRPTYINLKNPEYYQNDKTNPDELRKYLTIYYPDKTTEYLVPVTIKSDKIETEAENDDKASSVKAADQAKAALQHLIEGAEEIGLGIDEKMIKSLQIKDGVAVVDLDRNILLNKFSTKTQYAEIAIKSVVRTLTSIDEIEKVQFLVDGLKMGYITGNINIQNPIEPDKWYNFLTS